MNIYEKIGIIGIFVIVIMFRIQRIIKIKKYGKFKIK